MKTNINSYKGSILVADSCAGGLGVLKHILDWAGEYRVYYLADGEKNPFGLKTKTEIKEIVIRWIEGFQKRSNDLALVVVACNTASIAIKEDVLAIERKSRIPIITMVDGIKKSFKENLNHIINKKVLVTGTKYTINSEEYSKLLKEIKPKEIYNLCCTKTERFIARGLEKDKKLKSEVFEELSAYKNKKVETIVLGCTCFEFAKIEMRLVYGGNIIFLNPAIEVSNAAKNILQSKSQRININRVTIYTTGGLYVWRKSINITARRLFNKELIVKKIKL